MVCVDFWISGVWNNRGTPAALVVVQFDRHDWFRIEADS